MPHVWRWWAEACVSLSKSSVALGPSVSGIAIVMSSSSSEPASIGQSILITGREEREEGWWSWWLGYEPWANHARFSSRSSPRSSFQTHKQFWHDFRWWGCLKAQIVVLGPEHCFVPCLRKLRAAMFALVFNAIILRSQVFHDLI